MSTTNINRRRFLKRSAAVSAAAAVNLIWSCPAVGSAEEQSQTFHIFSLKAAQDRLRKTSVPDRQLISRLGLLNVVTGLIVDPKSGDCLLIGRRDPTLPDLRLSDLVVMMRSVFLHHDTQAPGVTIEPSEDGPRYGMQQVRYFAHCASSRVGQVCFRADLLMKQIGLSLEPPKVEGVQTYFDLSVDEARRSGRTDTEIYSRFWFYPVVARVVTVANGVLLDRCELEVLAEVMSASVGGKTVRSLDTFSHRPSRQFAKSFSDHFDELARAWPVLEELRSLSTLAAVTRGLARTDVQPDLGYWLREYSVPKVETLREVKTLRNAAPDLRFEVYGGVCLEALSLRLKGGDISAFTDAVLEARPSRDSLVWSVVLTLDRQIVVPALPGRLETSSAAGAYARGHHLFRGGRYDQAIACWLQVARTYPEMGETYYAIAQAFERKGMPACAADYYTKAMKYDPFIENLRRWNGSGVAHD